MNTKNEPTSKAQDRAEMQRNRILDAAQHCVIEHGFHAASMASIADTAGMSAGLIYRYFENKSAIILECIKDGAQDFCEPHFPSRQSIPTVLKML